jgi:hypothetical protein
LFPKYLRDRLAACWRFRKVRKLPSCLSSHFRLAALGNALILAREAIVAALLGLMVELRGLHPSFLAREQSVVDVLETSSFAAVVIDCDHPDCTEELLASIRKTGAVPILFSPFRMQSEVSEVAARHGIRSFALPTDPDTLGRMLEA